MYDWGDYMSDAFTTKDYTQVNFDAVGDLISEWKSTSAEYKGAVKKAATDQTFQKLGELDLIDDFPARYDTAMEGLASSIDSIISAIESYLNELETQDNSLEEEIPEKPPKTNKKSGNHGGGPLVNNYDAQLEFFNNISLDDLSEILSILNTIATDKKIPIDELLDDEVLGAQIKELLLSSPKISAQYKKMLQEGSTEVSMKALKSLINGNVKTAIGFDDCTTQIIKASLSNFAKSNNMELSDLLDQSNIGLLKKHLGQMKSVNTSLQGINKDNVQERLREIYNESLDDISHSVVKSEVDVLSEMTGISSEDLLTNPAYADSLLDSVENLKRSSIYEEMLSNCNDSPEILSRLLS